MILRQIIVEAGAPSEAQNERYSNSTKEQDKPDHQTHNVTQNLAGVDTSESWLLNFKIDENGIPCRTGTECRSDENNPGDAQRDGTDINRHPSLSLFFPQTSRHEHSGQCDGPDQESQSKHD